MQHLHGIEQMERKQAQIELPQLRIGQAHAVDQQLCVPRRSASVGDGSQPLPVLLDEESGASRQYIGDRAGARGNDIRLPKHRDALWSPRGRRPHPRGGHRDLFQGEHRIRNLAERCGRVSGENE